MPATKVNQEKLTRYSDDETDIGLGNIAEGEDGSLYVKCLTVDSIADDECVKQHTTTASDQRGYPIISARRVNGTIAETEQVVGWNNTGVTVPSGNYFWAKVGPIVTCQVGTTGTLSAGAPLFASTTAGEVDDTPTGSYLCLGVALEPAAGPTVISLLSYLM